MKKLGARGHERWAHSGNALALERGDDFAVGGAVAAEPNGGAAGTELGKQGGVEAAKDLEAGRREHHAGQGTRAGVEGGLPFEDRHAVEPELRRGRRRREGGAGGLQRSSGTMREREAAAGLMKQGKRKQDPTRRRARAHVRPERPAPTTAMRSSRAAGVAIGRATWADKRREEMDDVRGHTRSATCDSDGEAAAKGRSYYSLLSFKLLPQCTLKARRNETGGGREQTCRTMLHAFTTARNFLGSVH